MTNSESPTIIPTVDYSHGYAFVARSGGCIASTTVTPHEGTVRRIDPITLQPVELRPYRFAAVNPDNGNAVLMDRYTIDGIDIARLFMLDTHEDRVGYLRTLSAVAKGRKSPVSPPESFVLATMDLFLDHDADLASWLVDGILLNPSAGRPIVPGGKVKSAKATPAVVIVSTVADMMARAKAARDARALMVARFDVDTATLALSTTDADDDDALTIAKATLASAEATLAALLPVAAPADVPAAPADVPAAPAKAVRAAK